MKSIKDSSGKNLVGKQTKILEWSSRNIIVFNTTV